MDSRAWIGYFTLNAVSPRGIRWESGADLPDDEAKFVIPSLREFQLGESSDGRRLLHAGRRWAGRAGDGSLAEALALFVAEEQRHAAELARFIRLNGHATTRRSVADGVFRLLRHLTGGLEGSLTVLMVAEIVGYTYYSALRRATRSAVLRTICDVFLRDEALHLIFHVETLTRMRHEQYRAVSWLTHLLAMGLLGGTLGLVWMRHRRVLAGGGLSFGGFARVCFDRLRLAQPVRATLRATTVTSS